MKNNITFKLINVARSYERIVAEKRDIYIRAINHKKDLCHDEWEEDKRAYWELVDRAHAAEETISKLIYGVYEYFRVDDVIYVSRSIGTITRIPLGNTPDLAKEIDRVGSTM